jgi:hypothetical protein
VVLIVAAGNALLGKKVQQLRRESFFLSMSNKNEIEMENAESRLMKSHLAIVITTVVNFTSAIIEQETSWRWDICTHHEPFRNVFL